jgi:hypothetical protein
MNQTSYVNNWPDLLVYCIIGSCAGLIAGVLFPIAQISWNVLNAFELGPGQSATIGGIFGILCGVLFFFSRSDSPGYEKPSTVVYVRDDFVGSHAPQIINSILILTIVVQVILVKIWTAY